MQAQTRFLRFLTYISDEDKFPLCPLIETNKYLIFRCFCLLMALVVLIILYINTFHVL